ncbi:MAG: hypothetical protein ACK504_05890 [Bacteroidota bacterium]|jgi:hypothetical protein
MKKIYCSFYFIVFIGHFSNAQNNKNEIRDDNSKYILFTPPPLTLVAFSLPAEFSPYYGFDNKIKEICVNNVIPVDTPTKENFSNQKDYLVVLNKWLVDNPKFVKPEYLNKSIIY